MRPIAEGRGRRHATLSPCFTAAGSSTNRQHRIAPRPRGMLARAREAPTTVRYEPVSGLSWRARAHLASSPSCARRHLGLQWRPDRPQTALEDRADQFHHGAPAERRVGGPPPSCADHEQPAHALRLHRLEDGAASAPRRRPRPPSLAGRRAESTASRPATAGAQRLRVPQVAVKTSKALPRSRRTAPDRRPPPWTSCPAARACLTTSCPMPPVAPKTVELHDRLHAASRGG